MKNCKNAYDEKKRLELRRKLELYKLKQRFASPTDDMMSPCSRKLYQHKSHIAMVKSNPHKLRFSSKEKEEEL